MNLLKVIGGWFLDMIETAVFALSIFVLVYVFLAQPHQVSGNSMYPNFHTGEYLLTNKLAYRLSLPRRGEVIVFKAPSSAHCPTGGACDFIKRIIGEPGDKLSLQAGKFYVNWFMGSARPKKLYFGWSRREFMKLKKVWLSQANVLYKKYSKLLNHKP